MAFPDLICLHHYNGDSVSWLNAVYNTYYVEVVRGQLYFQNLPLSCKYTPATDGKGFAFWHCVSEDSSGSGREDDRTIDPRRCERIGWIAYAINNAQPQGNVIWWETIREGRTRVVIWIPADQYAVILEKRRDCFKLWTTYMVKSGRKKAFEKEHAAYWAKQKVGAAP